MCEKKARVGGIRTFLVGSRPRVREEVKCFAKICSSTSRLEHCWDELWGGTNAVTKLSFPAFSLSNKFISRASQSCN